MRLGKLEIAAVLGIGWMTGLYIYKPLLEKYRREELKDVPSSTAGDRTEQQEGTTRTQDIAKEQDQKERTGQ
ncbi:Hypp8990 [Branchiostoma lanceolatum]|uniref:Hypp8990 protein n=1 Tax=Branchiostoma lanceolatum TaxID=7740 RepID=A0A8J9ZCD6_BRALA|nr:Hypp8990 [Branchiostoma lanceolatum]